MATEPAPAETPGEQNFGRPPGGSFGVRLTGAASNPEGEPKALPKQGGEADTAAAEGEEAEVCFICASPIEHTSIAPCNHQTCHICSLRLRALYKTRACAHCRVSLLTVGPKMELTKQILDLQTEAPFVIFTDHPEKRFEEFTEDDFAKVDDNLGIKYEKDVIWEDTVLLLRYNCPDKDCDVACLGWPDLHRHVKTKHGKVMCDLCTRNKKVFTHEHELFTFGELRRHERFGDDQSGFKGHPECGFCRQRFYGDDELYNHCREKHERCHICDRRNGGRQPQYYLNYQELEKHFAADHFVCLDAECQANKTNVFETEMDLKAHQLSEHPDGLSKDARKDARLVSLSGFDIRTPYQPERRGGRDSRGSGRGRDPNAESLPFSSAQPISRAELAYQRQLAIQSSQSVSTRTFGGQLTPRAPPPAATAAVSRESEALPPVESLSLGPPPVSLANMTPQEQARALRHQAVTTRATTLLHNDQTKLSQFRTHISSYRSGTISATDLIDSFFSLFDCPSSELGKLVRELADLYENEQKRRGLLEAWNTWRSINEDYPSLPGPSGTVATAGVSSTGGRRVLTLKKSTVQSRQGSRSWGNVLAPGTNRDPFPALSAGTRTSASSNPRSVAAPPPIAWGNTTAPTVTSTSISRQPALTTSTSSISRAPSTRQPLALALSGRQSEEMFPSLPAAPKPNTMMPGFNTRGSVRWLSDSSSSSSMLANPWGNGGPAQPPAQADAPAESPVEQGASAGKKKGRKGKGKGETLFHFG